MNRIIPITLVAALILIASCKELPVASFTINQNTVEAGDTFYFQSTCQGADAFDWDFGDGSGSVEEDPWHIYTAKGTYTIHLTVTNSDGTDEANETLWVLPPSGEVLEVVVHSPGLEGNLLGDSPDREVTIYLPPGYYFSANKHYPVIYFLHGYTNNHSTYFGSGIAFDKIMDNLINTNKVDPMIIVSPNSDNKYDGSWYTNSIVTGNWEDFITQDVVQYVDNNYRTLATRESRGISGHSMGGYGTLKLAMRNPNLFSAAYMLSAACLVSEDFILGEFKSDLLEAVNAENIDALAWQAVARIALAAAVSPDPSIPPFYCQFPVTETGELIDSVWQKWLLHDPFTMLPAFKDSLLKLSALQFDCGIFDESIFVYPNAEFSTALNQIGVEHVFEEYEGNHGNKIPERIETKLLPFFSANLIHE